MNRDDERGKRNRKRGRYVRESSPEQERRRQIILITCCVVMVVSLVYMCYYDYTRQRIERENETYSALYEPQSADNEDAAVDETLLTDLAEEEPRLAASDDASDETEQTTDEVVTAITGNLAQDWADHPSPGVSIGAFADTSPTPGGASSDIPIFIIHSASAATTTQTPEPSPTISASAAALSPTGAALTSVISASPRASIRDTAKPTVPVAFDEPAPSPSMRPVSSLATAMEHGQNSPSPSPSTSATTHVTPTMIRTPGTTEISTLGVSITPNPSASATARVTPAMIRTPGTTETPIWGVSASPSPSASVTVHFTPAMIRTPGTTKTPTSTSDASPTPSPSASATVHVTPAMIRSPGISSSVTASADPTPAALSPSSAMNETTTPTPSRDVAIPMPLATADDGTLVMALETPSAAQESFEALLETNPETVGFLSIEDVISLPVVQRPNDNNFYLDHGFDLSNSTAGTLFLDGANVLAPEDNCLIVYGHNMRNGTMFQPLTRYEDITFLQDHPVVHFDTLYENRIWVPFAASTLSADPDSERYLDIREFIYDESGFDLLVRSLRTLSSWDSPLEVKYGDSLLLLVTCEYTHNNGRFVLALRAAREYESELQLRSLVQASR